MKWRILWTTLVVLSAMVGAARATTYEANSVVSIQEAIDLAGPSGDDVNVAPGIYYENLIIDKDVDIHSSDVNNPNITIIDGNYIDSVVTFENCGSGAKLRGFTITGGYAQYGSGGGIKCFNASPTISDCVIRGNSAPDGGGIACIDSSPTISDCYIVDN